VFRKQGTGTEALSNLLGISSPYKACFVRSDCKRDNKGVYQAGKCERFEKRVKYNHKYSSIFKHTNKETIEYDRNTGRYLLTLTGSFVRG
jgi:hypothetical protein